MVIGNEVIGIDTSKISRASKTLMEYLAFQILCLGNFLVLSLIQDTIFLILYQNNLLIDNSILIYRDPNDVFREFFGGIDPFEEMMDRKFHYCTY